MEWCHDEALCEVGLILLKSKSLKLMYFVYSIQSRTYPEQYYVGMTTNVDLRLADHNAGKSIHTNKFKPWTLISYVAFTDKAKAKKFEIYLKSGSGRSFCKRHF